MIGLRFRRNKQKHQWSATITELNQHGGACANCGCPLSHMCHSPLFGCSGFEPIEED